MWSQVNVFITLTKLGGKCVLTQIMRFIEPHRHERHHSSNLLSKAVIIVMDKKTWNISRETNNGFMMRFKTMTTNLSTIVHIFVETITSLAKPKASLEAFISIRKISWTVTSSKPVISPSLFSFLFFGNMLISNRYWWGTVESYVVNSSDRCRGRNTTAIIQRWCLQR